jgi:hypothetical protein
MSPTTPTIAPGQEVERERDTSAHAFAARSAVGGPAKRTNGPVPAGTGGTRSTLDASALPACTSGLKSSASLAADGRRTHSGMRLREK